MDLRRWWTGRALALAAAALLGACGGGASGPACPTGDDVRITTAQEWDALVACGITEVRGDLTITTQATTFAGAPALRTIGGALQVLDSPWLRSLAFPALTSVGALEIGRNGDLRAVDLPVLASAGKRVQYWSNVSLVAVRLPLLTTLVEDAYFKDLYSAVAIELPALQRAGKGVLVWNVPWLTSLDVRALSHAGSLTVVGCTSLEEAAFPLLTSIEGQVKFGQWSIYADYSNRALVRLELPRLAAAHTLELDANQALPALSLPALTHLWSLTITGCTSLVDLALPALAVVDAEVVIGDHLLTHESWGDYGNWGLERVDLGALTSAGEVRLMANRALVDLTLPVLASAQAITVALNPALTRLALPELDQVTGDLRVGMDFLSTSAGNGALAELELPQLTTVGGNVELHSNPALLDLRLPALATVGGDLTAGHYDQRTDGPAVSHAFPALVQVGGNLSASISRRGAPGAITLPALRTVGGDAGLGSGQGLQLDLSSLEVVAGALALFLEAGPPIALPSLRTAGGLDLHGVDALDAPLLAELSADLAVGAMSVEQPLVFPALARVGGSITADAWGLSSLTVPVLAQVGGSITVWSSSVRVIDAPALAAVGGSVQLPSGELEAFHAPALAGVGQDLVVKLQGAPELPSLSAVGGRLDLEGGAAAARLSLPALAASPGDVRLSCYWCTGLDLPLLAHVGGSLDVAVGPSLPVFTAPALVEVGLDLRVGQSGVALPALARVGRHLEVRGDGWGTNPHDGDFDLPSLETIGGDLEVHWRTKATRFGVPRLWSVGGRVEIIDHPLLTSFDLPSLMAVGGALEIARNPALPQCFALGFKDALVARGYAGSWTIAGNAAAATCGP